MSHLHMSDEAKMIWVSEVTPNETKLHMGMTPVNSFTIWAVEEVVKQRKLNERLLDQIEALARANVELMGKIERLFRKLEEIPKHDQYGRPIQPADMGGLPDEKFI